jgi:hypothetical protein
MNIFFLHDPVIFTNRFSFMIMMCQFYFEHLSHLVWHQKKISFLALHKQIRERITNYGIKINNKINNFSFNFLDDIKYKINQWEIFCLCDSNFFVIALEPILNFHIIICLQRASNITCIIMSWHIFWRVN